VSTLTESIAQHLAAKRDQNDPVSEARRQACPDTDRVIDVLENLGTPASLDVLRRCLDDPDPEIQLYAVDAADRLLGVE